MMRCPSVHKLSSPLSKALVALLMAATLTGCLRNTASEEKKDEYVVPDLLVDTETYWDQTPLLKPNKDGLMNPYFDAVMDADKTIHIVYYEVAEEKDDEGNAFYNIQYNKWNTLTKTWAYATPMTVVQLNHTDRITLDQGANGHLYVGYRGGNPQACNGNRVLADAMFAVFDGTKWSNYTGGIGFVERSAGALQDGLAGQNNNIAVDRFGNVHLSYQFFYEGCDENNFRYPDLLYVQKTPAQFANDNRGSANIEEQISGNDYLQGGNHQNNTGEISALFINQQDQPVSIFYADHAGALGEGLYMSYREADGQWQTETIMEGCEVEDVVAGQANNGDLHAFFVVDDCDTGDDRFALMHAMKKAQDPSPDAELSQWQTGYVINNVYVGGNKRRMDMTFDLNDKPQVIYYELQTYSDNPLNNLVSIKLNQTSSQYIRQDIAKWNNVGSYSRVVKDQDNEVYVLSYSEDTETIHLFIQGVDGRDVR